MTTKIGDIRWRERVTVEGKVEVIRLQPAAHIAARLEIIISDGTGSVSAIFAGYRTIGGLALGSRVRLQGIIVAQGNRLALLNPVYTLLPRE